MTELCRNCGNYMPNAVGPGVYCEHCGEPKDKPRPAAPAPLDKKDAQHTNEGG
jgi:hypothetical protein